MDTPDLPAALAELRAQAEQLAPEGLRCKIMIPDEQIRYLTISGVPNGAERSMARVALEGATPYKVEQLSFDCVRLRDGNLSIAAVAHETLDEAEAFALEHGFPPFSFAALPASDTNYPTEPYLGTALHAREVMPKGEEVRRDHTLVQVIGKVEPKIDPLHGMDDKIPLPDFDTASEEGGLVQLHSATKAREDEAEAPFEEVTIPDEPAEISPDLSAATLTAQRSVPKAPSNAKTDSLKAERKGAAPGMFTVIGGMLASSKLPLPRDQEPAKLGMLATAAVVVMMGAVGATATLFTDGATPVEEAEMVIPITPVPADELDLAELEEEPEVLASLDDALATPAPTSEQTDETLAMNGEASELLPDVPALAQPKPDPIILSPEELRAHYDQTGVFAMAPTPPRMPRVADDHEAYVPSKDQPVLSLDAVSLPDTETLAVDELPLRPSLPDAAEERFALDDDGLVEPTPEGTPAPGATASFWGTRPLSRLRGPTCPPLKMKTPRQTRQSLNSPNTNCAPMHARQIWPNALSARDLAVAQWPKLRWPVRKPAPTI